MSAGPIPREGWSVPARPAALAMVALLTLLSAVLVAGGFWYDARFAPRTRPRIGVFPAPRLETGQRPPRTPIGAPPRPPRGIDAAMRAVADGGDALWAQK